jgi:cation/acetate symporter
VLTTLLGFGSRAALQGSAAVEKVGEGGNLAVPYLAENLGGGAGSVGGDAFLAIVAAVAFATILAVVAGLVISASGAVAHDVYSNIIKSGEDSEKQEVWVGRLAALGIGLLAMGVSILAGEGLNVSFVVGLAFAVAASAVFPALLLAFTWRRFNTTGALTNVITEMVSSIFLMIISPKGWPGPDGEGGAFSFYDLSNPGIISIPLGFIACWLGSILSGEEKEAEREFEELYVRSETGLGAEDSDIGLPASGNGASADGAGERVPASTRG